MTMDNVGARLEADRAAFPDETGSPKDLRTAHRLGPRGCVSGAVNRRLGALAVSQITNGLDWICFLRIDHLVGDEGSGQLQTFRRDDDGDNPRAHGFTQKVCATHTRP